MPQAATLEMQESRREVDEWEDMIASQLIGRSQITVGEAADIVGIKSDKLDRFVQRRISGILRLLGYSRIVTSIDGRSVRVWARNAAAE